MPKSARGPRPATSLRDPNRKPTHPGAILREDVLPSLRMTQTKFAQRLGVSRVTVTDIVYEKRPVSVDMAIRLGKLLAYCPINNFTIKSPSFSLGAGWIRA